MDELNLIPDEQATKDYVVAELINGLAEEVFEANGDWYGYTPSAASNTSGKFGNIHLAISEAFAAYKQASPDKVEEALADVLQQVFCLAVAFGLKIGNAYVKSVNLLAKDEEV
jgi:NTP pyrophosphatase (non-canonical NTP hydrolase)